MPRMIAIDLGNHAVKVSTYRLVGRKIEFDSRLHQPVAQAGESPSLAARMDALDALLEQHPELASPGSNIVVTTMPGQRATFHRLSMPFTDRAQIEKTLPFAVEGEVPFDLDEMVLGWRVLHGDQRATVMVALIRHDEISETVQALAQRSLDPAEVYLDAELLGYYADDEEPGSAPADHAVAVIDVGHLRTLVTVVVAGAVVFCRAVNFGGHTITRAIQRALDCTWEEAEHHKHGTRQHPAGAPDEGDGESTDVTERPRGERAADPLAALPERARPAVDGALGLLLAEIRSTLIKAEDTVGVSVDEVRLLGGGSRVAALREFLARDLGLPIRAARDPQGEAIPSTFLLAHAMAMQSFDGAPEDVIDLRVGDLEFRGGTNFLRAALVYGTAGLVFFATAAVLMFAFQYASLLREQSNTDERTIEILGKSFPEIDLADFADERSTKLALAEGFTEDAEQRAEILGQGSAVPRTVDTLAQLTAAFPPHPDVKVDVTSLVITPTQISFDAETDGGYASSAQVEAQLQAHPLFGRAEKGTEKKVGTSVRFPITISLVDEDVEPAEEG